MSATRDKVIALVAAGEWQSSEHALNKLIERGIFAADLVATISTCEVVEDSPGFALGPCVLVLQADRTGPVHALWGLEAGTERPAVLITVYRPDPTKWHDDNRTRRP